MRVHPQTVYIVCCFMLRTCIWLNGENFQINHLKVIRGTQWCFRVCVRNDATVIFYSCLPANSVFNKNLLMWTATIAFVLLFVCCFKTGSAGEIWKMSCSISVCADWGWRRSALCILMLKIKLLLLKELR